MTQSLIVLIYLIGSCCFIVGLKLLSSPRTAVLGNYIGSIGMLAVVSATFLLPGVGNFGLLLSAILIGSILGLILAFKTPMTAMPEMVGILNGFGGAASALVATAELLSGIRAGTPPGAEVAIPLVLGSIIGWVTLTGSLIAAAKLHEIVSGRPITYPLQNISNILLGLLMIVFSVLFVMNPSGLPAFWAVSAIAFALGILIVIPIGGGDMPVVICLMNAYSGLAGAATGFAINNHALIISGSLVGSSGIILTFIMCKAMNRSVYNVFFGAFGKIQAVEAGPAGAQGNVKSAGAEDVAMMMDAAQSVVIVPGYGMAVAQAQHAVRELADVLKARGTEVRYAIHPVAGRMPGHMNVLLAEANAPYEEMCELEQINPMFAQTDVVLVVGANDIVNPAARANKSSPIYGMPILDVDRAKSIVVIKRSMRPGFAGIDNDLYVDPKTVMYFGDAKSAVLALVTELKRS